MFNKSVNLRVVHRCPELFDFQQVTQIHHQPGYEWCFLVNQDLRGHAHLTEQQEQLWICCGSDMDFTISGGGLHQDRSQQNQQSQGGVQGGKVPSRSIPMHPKNTSIMESEISRLEQGVEVMSVGRSLSSDPPG